MRVRLSRLIAVVSGLVLVSLVAPVAFGHIKIFPTQSTFGAREKYTMRVPNERQSPAIRVEGEFPAGLEIYDFEFKSGWKIDFKKNDKGKIIGATWTGKIAPYEFVEFGMLAINPKDALAYNFRASAYAEKKDLKRANADEAKYRELDGKDR